MTLAEVKQFLTDNAELDEVKAFRAEISNPTEAKVTEILEGFKKSKEYQSEIDRAVTNGVKTHDEKIKPVLEKELRAKITNELNPPKDPAVLALQEELKKIREEKAEADSRAENEKRVNFFHSQIKPDYKDFVKLFDGSISDDAEKVKFVNEKLFELQSKGTPKPSQGSGSISGQITDRSKLKSMSPEEINKARLDGSLSHILAGE
jgi:hypothetical protein